MCTIGYKIKRIRKHMKLTQTQLADDLGVTPANISQIESGVREPSLTLVKLFKLIYCVDEQWWECTEGDMLNDDLSRSIASFYRRAPTLTNEELCEIMRVCVDILRSRITH